MIKRVLILLACLCLLGVSSFAQRERRGGEATHENIIQPIQTRAGASDDERDLRQIVEKLMMLRLRKALDLSEEQLHALVKCQGAFEERLTKMKFERETARERLRECLDIELPEAEIREKLEALLDQEKAIAEVLQEMIEEAGKDLTTPQTARLYLFVGDFENFMRKQINRAKYISRHGEPPEVAVEPSARSRTTEERLIEEELVRREAAGPLPHEAADAGMVDLFDGLLMAMLSQALELSPEEAVVLFRRIGTYKDQLHELKWQIGNARADLRSSLEAGAPNVVVERRLGDLLLQERAVAELIRRLVTEARKDVGLAKSARLYLFVGDFEQYVIRLLHRAGAVSARYQTRLLEPQP